MTKDALIFSTIVLALLGIIGYVIVESNENEKQLLKHHCKEIHRNADRTQYEYDAALKMMMPKTYRGAIFYECDDGEWRKD